MSLPRFIDIDGRRYLWRDLVALRQAQAQPRAEQPTLARYQRLRSGCRSLINPQKAERLGELGGRGRLVG